MTKFKTKRKTCRECGADLPDEKIKWGNQKVYQCKNEDCRAINAVFFKVLVYIKDPYGPDVEQIHQFMTRAKRDRFLKECDKSGIKYKIVSKKAIL